MKIAAIAKVIKDRGSCRLYRVHGPDDVETKFYIGTNSEIYSLEGFPKPWSEAEVMTMLGIEKKKWEDVIYTAYDCNTITDVCGLNLEDAVQNEVECKTSYINLNIGGALLMGLTDPDEKAIDFIAASRLVPVMDEIKKSDYINYCLRHTTSGSRYCVIRDGMIVRAAILPITLSEGLVKGMQNIVNMTQNTVQSCKTEDKEAE
jgi:hypothetical protein